MASRCYPGLGNWRLRENRNASRKKLIAEVLETTEKDGRVASDQVPDFGLIQVLRWFVANGDDVYVRSAGTPLWAALAYPEKYPFMILVADSSRPATLNPFAIKH
jgi:hypothetical protein